METKFIKVKTTEGEILLATDNISSITECKTEPAFPMFGEHSSSSNNDLPQYVEIVLKEVNDKGSNRKILAIGTLNEFQELNK